MRIIEVIAFTQLLIASKVILASQVEIFEISVESLKKLTDLTNNDTALLASVDYGEESVEKLKRLESAISRSRVKVIKGSISYAQLIDGYPSESTKHQDLIAKTVLKASTYFLNNFCKSAKIPDHEVGLFLSQIEIPESQLYEKCTEALNAKSYNDTYRRLIPAAYSDGIYKFRKSVTGSNLPSARQVSSKFYKSNSENEHKDTNKSIAFVQWSQFIEHDLAKTVVQSMHNGEEIECCSQDFSIVAPRYEHPSCKPLKISENDEFYKNLGVTCLNYVRSALALNTCTFGPANQLNQATNKLDLSQIYGNTAENLKKLRTHRNGRLQVHVSDKMEFLVSESNNYCAHNSTYRSSICYTSGDTRVNINPYITLLHTIFLRSHNKIARKINNLNRRWNDARVYEVTRLINIGIYKKIVYQNWLAAIIGNTGLKVFSTNHDPRVSNEFATAAIRFYNTMMPGRLNPKRSFENTVNLQDVYYKPKDLSKKEYFNFLVNAVLEQNAMALDTDYVDDLSTLLFKTNNFGTDALALDIQRGRDHGLNSYIEYYKFCNEVEINDWADLDGVVREKDLFSLKSTYKSVQDIDLIIGAISEIPRSDAAVGPTLSCIIGDQLLNSLGTDETLASDASTENIHAKVLSTIENYSAARLICDTTQVSSVQENIFYVPSSNNPMLNCADLPKLDISVWRERMGNNIYDA